MVKVLVRRPSRSEAMNVVTSGGRTYSMESTPPVFSYAQAAVLGTIEREGRRALTRATGPGLRTLSFTHTVGSMNWKVDIEQVAKRFTKMAADGERVRFSGGSSAFEAPCWWMIEECSVSVIQRATNNHPSRLELSWQLVEAVDVDIRVMKRPTKPKPKPPTKRPTPVRNPPYRTHRVVRGDTLWWISHRYLGKATRWREIYRLNRKKIKNPHWIYPGQVFKIPRR